MAPYAPTRSRPPVEIAPPEVGPATGPSEANVQGDLPTDRRPGYGVDDAEILRELELLESTVGRGRRPSPEAAPEEGPAPSAPPPTVAEPPSTAEPIDLAPGPLTPDEGYGSARVETAVRPAEPEPVTGEPSGYLEERLFRVRRTATGMGREVRELAERSDRLRGQVAALERELERANRELRYARGHELLPGPVPRPSRSAPVTSADELLTWRSVSRCQQEERAGPEVEGGAGRYQEYTVARYNQTMTGLKDRRMTVASIGLIVAGLLSIALVAVAVYSRYPQPPMWIAVLPAIWMIPVPFFVLSFRGTHRVLRRNHFDLAEER